MKKLKVTSPNAPVNVRKNLIITRPASLATAGCLLCGSDTHVRVIQSELGAEIMLCKPCINELSRRQVSNAKTV